MAADHGLEASEGGGQRRLLEAEEDGVARELELDRLRPAAQVLHGLEQLEANPGPGEDRLLEVLEAAQRPVGLLGEAQGPLVEAPGLQLKREVVAWWRLGQRRVEDLLHLERDGRAEWLRCGAPHAHEPGGVAPGRCHGAYGRLEPRGQIRGWLEDDGLEVRIAKIPGDPVKAGPGGYVDAADDLPPGVADLEEEPLRPLARLGPEVVEAGERYVRAVTELPLPLFSLLGEGLGAFRKEDREGGAVRRIVGRPVVGAFGAFASVL